MLERVIDNVAKAAEASLQMQQEAFKQWVGLLPGVPATQADPAEQVLRFERTWAEFYEDVLRKQWRTWAVEFQVGLKQLENASHFAAGTIDLWWKVYETLHLSCFPGAAGAGTASDLETLERSALAQVGRGLPPPREVYDAPTRSRIDWSRFPSGRGRPTQSCLKAATRDERASRLMRLSGRLMPAARRKVTAPYARWASGRTFRTSGPI